MLTDYGVPALHWLRGKLADLAAYVDRFLEAVDPGEDEDDVVADYTW
jgi:hypothetical protein